MGNVPTAADPRPRVRGEQILGVRCRQCGRPSAFADLRCRRCLGEVAEAGFGPEGVVWSSAVVHLEVDHRSPPFALAYVDLADGPRILALVDAAVAPDIGTSVRVVGERDGDVLVEVVDHA